MQVTTLTRFWLTRTSPGVVGKRPHGFLSRSGGDCVAKPSAQLRERRFIHDA